MTNDEWITVSQAANLSGYNEEHIRRLLREGLIHGRKFGIVWQVRHSSMTAYLKKAQVSEDRRHGPKDKSPDQ
jgi:Helix-turn-helix domain